MLSKLVKYDLKYGIKIFTLLQAILIFACILGRLLFMDKVDYSSDTNTLVPFLTLFVLTFSMLYSAIEFGVLFLVAIRFYRNLFTDEGYLTWTLPATPTQQLGAKIISGTVWYILSTLLGSMGLLILVTGKNTLAAYAKAADEINKSIGMPLTHYAGTLLCLALFCSVGSVILLYLSIAIGQLFPGHKVLCSIVTYFCITTVTQVITFFLLFMFDVFPSFMTQRTGSEATKYIMSVFQISTYIFVFMAIIGYLMVRYIMNKKINLN